MTAADLAFLRVLADHGPAGPGWLGSIRWPTGASSAHYARSAGLVLRRLQAGGLAGRSGDRWRCWTITDRGLHHLRVAALKPGGGGST